MDPRILSIGTALPETRIGQAAAARVAAALTGVDERGARTLAALYRRSGVEERGAVVVDGVGRPWFFGAGEGEGGCCGPTTGARLAVFEVAASDLAERASRDAIERACVAVGSITHLITVSCTGFGAPGVDHALITRLGLDASVQRTNIGFMGCHAAVNGLRVAEAIARADSSAMVLVCCVELCSLHFQYEARGEGQAVANALFADGAAAAVVAAGEEGDGAGVPTIRSTSSRMFPDSADAMSWRIGEHGFEMTLSARVPELLVAQVPAWIDGWLASLGMTRGGVGGWAIHPGGPRIVAGVREALGLPASCCAHSTGVLAAHGNMSSPTILFILERLRAAGVARPWVAMAFGPGLAGEAVMVG